jgi:4-diphosphocytidyl-2-C-methyl-D-erythritol kinase
MTRVVVPAHAKINLCLEIVGRRVDGYHDLCTVVQSVTLADTLIVEQGPSGMTLEVEDPTIPSDATNLVWQAAEQLAASRKQTIPGTRIRLEKRIPAGAGLGGGSSDAAACLVALNRLWNVGLSIAELVQIAARLGSDVPYFLQGGTALLTGRGIVVTALPDLPKRPILLVYPGAPLTSREVYSQLTAPLTPGVKTASMTRFRPNADSTAEAWVRFGNDLAPHAKRLCPDIGVVEECLLAAGASAVGMTGSGSAVFGVFRSAARMQGAVRSLARPGWRVMSCELLGCRDYQHRLGLAGRGFAPSWRDVGHGDH